MARITLETPVGHIWVSSDDGAVTGISWGRPEAEGQDPVLDQARAELDAYFAGKLTEFTVPLALPKPGFKRDFLQALIDIPFGETRSYGDLAKELGVSAQAIGQACGANYIPIIIPCHRVLGAQNLGGFSGAGGVETKVALLKHEGAASLLI